MPTLTNHPECTAECTFKMSIKTKEQVGSCQDEVSDGPFPPPYPPPDAYQPMPHFMPSSSSTSVPVAPWPPPGPLASNCDTDSAPSLVDEPTCAEQLLPLRDSLQPALPIT